MAAESPCGQSVGGAFDPLRKPKEMNMDAALLFSFAPLVES